MNKEKSIKRFTEIIANMDGELKKVQAENKKLSKREEKLERLILNIYEACLCERFKTKGFDYGENHLVLGSETGSRFSTPRDMIKSIIGSEWVYKHPTKPGQSMERLKFIYVRHGKGFKSDKEWKELEGGE